MDSKRKNDLDTNEAWLTAGLSRIGTHISQKTDNRLKIDHNLRVKGLIAFTSAGKNVRGPEGKITKPESELWTAEKTDDKRPLIIVRCDLVDPVRILDRAAQELVKLLTGEDGYRDTLLQVGWTIGKREKGGIRNPLRGSELTEFLTKVASDLGDLPHGKLNFLELKKQTTRQRKAECLVCKAANDPYIVRLSTATSKKGLPLCPIHSVALVWDDAPPATDLKAAAE